MIQQLSDKLLSMLSVLKGTGQPFVSVLDYHTLENTGYPYLTFEPVAFDATIADTCNNERTFVFQLLVFQEVTESGGRKEAKEILVKGVDDIISILDNNYTMDGLCSLVQPVGATIRPFIINDGKALVAELTVNIKVMQFIY